MMREGATKYLDNETGFELPKMELKFEFGKDLEAQRVKWTLAAMDWYRENGYAKNLRLPENITEESSSEEIEMQIAKEYDVKAYEEMVVKTNDSFKDIGQEFFCALKKVFGEKVSENYIVRLTGYGTGGSYKTPNTITINIRRTDGPIKTVVHEIIHLQIEDKIKSYGVEHWEKERIVDMILNSKEFAFLDYNSWQRGYGDTEKYIDDLFRQKFFTDHDGFFAQIKEAREKSKTTKSSHS